MKILFVIPSLGSGGAEKHLQNLVNSFEFKQHEITIALINSDKSYAVNEKITLVNIGSKYIKSSTFNMLFGILKLKKLLSQHSYDFVIPILDYSVLISRLCKSNVKSYFVACLQNNLTKNKNDLPFLLKWLWNPIVNSYHHMDKIICLSEGVQSSLITNFNVPKSKTTVIYNAAWIHDNDKKRLEALDIFNNFNGTLISAIGRLEKQKDYKTLIDAINYVKDKHKVKLIILGKGRLESELISYVKLLKLEGEIKFLGFVSNPYQYLEKSKIFVLSSAWEGFGNVIVEAMMCNNLIVSTDCPYGPSEILNDGEFGKLVQVGNSQKLADAIIETINNKNTSDITKNRERGKMYDSELIAKQYTNYLMDTLCVE